MQGRKNKGSLPFRGSTLLPPLQGTLIDQLRWHPAFHTRFLSGMQLGSGFHTLSPDVSHPLSRTSSQRQNQILLVFVSAVGKRIIQTFDNGKCRAHSPWLICIAFLSAHSMPNATEDTRLLPSRRLCVIAAVSVSPQPIVLTTGTSLLGTDTRPEPSNTQVSNLPLVITHLEPYSL